MKLLKTSGKRVRREVVSKPRFHTIMNVLESEQMQEFWKKYRTDYDYAHDISFEAAIGAITGIMTELNL